MEIKLNLEFLENNWLWISLTIIYIIGFLFVRSKTKKKLKETSDEEKRIEIIIMGIFILAIFPLIFPIMVSAYLIGFPFPKPE